MGPFGSDIKKEFYTSHGVPVLNGSNLQGFKLGEDSFGYVTEEKANSLKKCIAKRGDIVVTHRGTLGQMVYIPDDSKFDRYLISQSQFRYRLKKSLARPDFVVYYFHTLEGQYKLLSNASQVGVPALARATTTFRQLEIPLPPLSVQNKIVTILSSLDARIENNNKINANLEAQAQALFKSWFVDFEPFQDGEFQDSELGRIPKGWKVYSLEEIAFFDKNSINPGKTPEKLFSHYSLPAFDEKKLPEKQFGKEILSNKFSISNNTILLSKLNPRIKRIWYVEEVEENAICSTEFIPFKAKDNNLTAFLYCYLTSQLFYDNALGMVNGATGSHQRFDVKYLLTFKFAASEESMLKFSSAMKPLLSQIFENIQETKSLSTLRDTLLPKLMSGEIEV